MSRGLRILKVPTWFAVFRPRGASEPIIRRLNQAAFATADTQSVLERLNALAARIHRGADFGG
jgi:tripartite-type tricarboxylate transporter receptor subunit TctC